MSRTLDRPNFRMMEAGFSCQKLNYGQRLQPLGGQRAKDVRELTFCHLVHNCRNFCMKRHRGKLEIKSVSFISIKWAYPQTTYCVLSQQVAGWFPGPEAHDDLGSALQIDDRGGQWRRAEYRG